MPGSLTKPASKAPSHLSHGDPYCGKCGYALVGATETHCCPECGEPLVETLERKGLEGVRIGRRYQSKARIFGVPVISVAFGPDARTGERVGRPRGLIALGDLPRGGIAIGGAPVGVVALGGVSFGVFTAGGVAVGLLASMGGVATSLGMSVGGVVAGVLATGSTAVGVVARGAVDPETQRAFDDLAWYFGSGALSGTQSALCVAAVIAAASFAILALAALRLQSTPRTPS